MQSVQPDIATYNPFEEIESLARENGVSLAEACTRTGLAYSTLCRWRNKNPKTVQAINDLRAAIIAIAKEGSR